MNQQSPTPRDFLMGDIKCSTHSIPQLLRELRLLLRNRAAQPRSLLCLNAHIFNLACEDPLLREDLNSARIVTADGMSIVWFARLWRVLISDRCNMTEAFRAFLEEPDLPASRGLLVGLNPDEAAVAARAMEARSNHCRIHAVCSGYLAEEEYHAYFAALEPLDFIFVGMGTPRTERVCRIAAIHCPEAIVWGIGAGTIRIFSGTMREAPLFFRRSGLQWLHRLLREPQLLWRRYLIGNPLFVYRMFKLALSERRGVAPASTAYRS